MLAAVVHSAVFLVLDAVIDAHEPTDHESGRPKPDHARDYAKTHWTVSTVLAVRRFFTAGKSSSFVSSSSQAGVWSGHVRSHSSKASACLGQRSIGASRFNLS